MIVTRASKRRTSRTASGVVTRSGSPLVRKIGPADLLGPQPHDARQESRDELRVR